jgi:hypothetical protein
MNKWSREHYKERDKWIKGENKNYIKDEVTHETQ